MRLLLELVPVAVLAGIPVFWIWWRRRTGRWRVIQKVNGRSIQFELHKPGERPLPAGTVDPADEDFDERYAELRAEARSKANTLNAGLRS
jgi:hypothetical protein